MTSNAASNLARLSALLSAPLVLVSRILVAISVFVMGAGIVDVFEA